MSPKRIRSRLIALVWIFALLSLSRASILGGDSSSVTIPRSTHRSEDSPPWNPSSHIDEDGFLLEKYVRCAGEWEEEANIGGRHGPRSRRYKQLETVPVKIRQVPGDGNCLFHSIATCLTYAVEGDHICMKDTTDLRRQSQDLRQRAVDKLESRKKLLFLQGHEYLRAKDLVDAAASQYGLSGERYCELMRQESYWGGGPEIVALCNALRRPIHVYELHSHRKQFKLRRMACFGSPKFDRREPLHILSADSRFPDVSPGKQLDSGNHFLAVFPESHRVPRKAGVRGGDNLICRGEPHARWKFATWLAVWWSTFSWFWMKPK
eukprot:CAMPEP_0202486852 /NCGR_PEP_ID=MMETSP1361-20130828/5324_1 /ASSEMBLY_ACC=CAM_ASM_000849 /TAXON_ID=210615 /ORGANISM="Staurosira complex sp., Strain CCMP2646" /LENGTH=320 /DNA_ID=CAMNT_0049116111 /DNA_START=38 /DNA_END=1000 /DNA_ORIENTATION=+